MRKKEKRYKSVDHELDSLFLYRVLQFGVMAGSLVAYFCLYPMLNGTTCGEVTTDSSMLCSAHHGRRPVADHPIQPKYGLLGASSVPWVPVLTQSVTIMSGRMMPAQQTLMGKTRDRAPDSLDLCMHIDASTGHMCGKLATQPNSRCDDCMFR